MAGTVRGTFDLNARPASTSLRRLQTQGDKTDRTMKSVGRSLDKIGTPKQVRRLDIYKRKLEQVERAGKRTFRTIRKEWTATDRQVTKSVALQSKEIDHLQTKLEELALIKASPEIDVDGVTEALAQVELLHRRLKALGRERVVPRIGIGATGARAAATGAAGGVGRSGGEGLIRSMNLGPFNLGKRGFPILAAAGLPAVTSLGGAAVGVAGSAGAGALGAGALGIAGGGILTTAIGSIASVAIPTAAKLKEASTALKAFQKEVLQSGRNSVAAREKWREFNAIAGQTPGVRRFLRERTRLSKRFQGATGPARSDFLGIGTNAFEAGNALTPQFAKQTNRFFARGNEVSDRFFGEFATGRRSRRFLKSAGDQATESLDEIEAITEHVLGSLMNITVASRPFFREALNFLEEWTGGWLDSTDNIGRTRDTVREMVGHLKAWLKLGSSTFKLMKDLMSAGAGPGKGLVFELTDQLETWDRWVRRNPRQVKTFFRDTVDSTQKMASALGKVGKALFEISKMLTPLLDQFSDLVSFLGNAGLLTPGGLPLLISGGAGIRNASRGFGSRVRGGVPGSAGTAAGAPIIVGGGAAAGGAAMRGGRYFRDTYSLARGFGYGRAASTVAGAGAAAMGPRPTAFARGFAGRVGPLMAISAGLGALSTPGNAEERFSAGASAATFGLTAPLPTGAEREDKGYKQGAYIVRQISKRAGSLRKQEAALLAAIRRTRGMEEESYADRHPDSLIGMIGGQEDSLSDEERRTRLQTQRGALGQIRGARGAKAETAGARASTDFYRAFRIRSKDRGAGAAMDATIKPALDKLSQLGPKGGRIFAQNTLRWAREAKRKNPELSDEYDELADKVERRFRRMGVNVKVIHGRIYTDSKASWERIKSIVSSQAWAAEQESSKAFGKMEQEVFRRLKAFGFTGGQAKALIQSGGDVEGAMTMGAGMATVGKGRVDPHFLGNRGGGGKGNAKGGRNRFAGGGRFGGFGRQDNVPLAGGGVAAPDEFWIGNRHTERRLNSMLAPYGTSVGREIEGETMKHSSAPLGRQAFAASLGRRFGGFASGGRGRFARGGITAAATLAQQLGLTAGEGPGQAAPGVHVPGSLHYSGLAYDISGSPSAMRRYFFAALRSFKGSINELFYDPIGWRIDDGQKVAGAIGGHSDHVHIGFFPGGAKGGGAIGGLGGALGAGRSVNLKRQRSKLGGVPGALAQRGMDAVKAGMEQAVNRKLGVGARGAGRMERRFAGKGLQRFNHSYPEMHLGEQGTKLPGGAIESIASSAGLPPRLFRQISIGESGDYPGMVGVDPGGTEGLGLWMITTGYNDSLIRRLGGRKAMLNPVINAQAAKEIYDSQGSGAWYGTSHVTKSGWAEDKGARGGRFARGGRPRWAGSFRKGGDFLTRPGRAVALEAGEGLEQEEISVRPRQRPGGVAGKGSGSGGRGRGLSLSIDLNFNGPVHVRSERDLEKIKKSVADGLLEALRQTDSVREEEVLG